MEKPWQHQWKASRASQPCIPLQTQCCPCCATPVGWRASLNMKENCRTLQALAAPTGKQHRMGPRTLSRSCLHQCEAQQWYHFVTHRVSPEMFPPTRSRAVPCSHTRLCHQTWFLGLPRAQGSLLCSFRVKRRKFLSTAA